MNNVTDGSAVVLNSIKVCMISQRDYQPWCDLAEGSNSHCSRNLPIIINRLMVSRQLFYFEAEGEVSSCSFIVYSDIFAYRRATCSF